MVAIAEGGMLAVNLPSNQVGYSIVSDAVSLGWHDDYKLTLTLDEGYSKTPLFTVKVNGVEVQSESNEYIISNVESEQTVTVEGIADITAPTGEITLGVNKWNQFLNTITFGLFYKDTQTVSISGADFGSGVNNVEYFISDTILSETEVRDIVDWNEYEDTINLVPDSQYVVYAKVTDKSNNVIYICSNGIVIDNIVPVIVGIEDEKVYCDTITFTVMEEYLDKVYIDGEEASSNDEIYTIPGDDEEHVVKIIDKSGNETVITVTVNTEHTYGEWNVVSESKCETGGEKMKKCIYCDDEQTEPIPETGHDFKEPTYEWNSDYSKATVIFECVNGCNHVETITKDTTSQIIRPATDSEPGEAIYTVIVIKDGVVYTKQIEVSIPIVDGPPEGSTEESTEGSTEESTEGSTEESTEGSTEESTEGSTEESTEGSTEESTEGSTEESTEGSTEESTEGSTEESTEGSTEESTEGSTEESTEGNTEESTEETTEESQDGLGGESMEGATGGSSPEGTTGGSSPEDSTGGSSPEDSTGGSSPEDSTGGFASEDSTETETDEDIVVPPLGNKNTNVVLFVVMTFFGMIMGIICLITHRKKKCF